VKEEKKEEIKANKAALKLFEKGLSTTLDFSQTSPIS
jgi:hypothetical protein